MPLREQLLRVELLHKADLRDGLGAVYLPEGLGRKFPSAARELGWQWVFPSKSISKDRRPLGGGAFWSWQIEDG